MYTARLTVFHDVNGKEAYVHVSKDLINSLSSKD